jgi:hypothetical protein
MTTSLYRHHSQERVCRVDGTDLAAKTVADARRFVPAARSVAREVKA